MHRRIFEGCALATMVAGERPYGLLSDGAIAIVDGKILWAGPRAQLPSDFQKFDSEDLGGRLMTPALIDCHTHLVYGGNRAQEFEMRLNGATYEQIAKAGGGINSTVQATRAASDDELLAQSLRRLDALIAEGVGTVEIKSGYALNIEGELRLLRIARRLGEERDVRIRTTWLAAHALPKDFNGDHDAYIDAVAIPGLEQAHEEGLVDAVDAYCENIAFSCAHVSRLFDKARALGLPVKLHAEQLSDQKGAVLAAEYDALSADHLEYLAPEDAGALAGRGVVAVLLPGAFYTLKETKLPPIEALRAAGVPIAVATDCNPGTSPIASIRLIMNMACTLFGLTPEETFAGATRNAARALGLSDEIGTIEAGKKADLAVWDVEHPSELFLNLGGPLLHRRINQETFA